MIPPKSQIYLGNSLPIREWDLAASREQRHYSIHASRGLNGIDGQISTFLGLCSNHHPNWGIIGDLTALYDLAGPWILSQLPDITAKLVIINNGGGKIFSRMYEDPDIQNQHQLHFEPLAKLWGIHYEQWKEIPKSTATSASQIIEIIPDNDATERFWKRLAAL